MKNPLKMKLYYSISEVAEITTLQPYTLRAWEKEFSCLRPRRIHGKNRAYRERDINIILLIKRLLYEERYTTQGASKKLKEDPGLLRKAVDSGAFRGTDGAKGEAGAGPEEKTRAAGNPVLEDRMTGSSAANSAVAGAEGGMPEGGESVPKKEATTPLKELLEGTRKELNEVLQLLG